MFFIFYKSRPALFAASVGGVTLGVALLLLPWKNMSIGKRFFSRPFLANRRISNSLRGVTNFEQQGDCRIVEYEKFKDLINKISAQKKHVVISCSNDGNLDDGILESNWIALFPINLFKEGEEFLKKDNFFIKTVTRIMEEEEELKFRTTFSSNEFSKTEIVGKWVYDGLAVTKDKTIDIVTLEGDYSTEKIYFVHGN